MWRITRWKRGGELCVRCDFEDGRRAACGGTEPFRKSWLRHCIVCL